MAYHNLQPWVINHYNESRSKKNMPIEFYIDSIITHMPGVTYDDIYEPITVNLQLSKFNAVPVQIDFKKNWQSELKNAAASMIGQKVSDITLKNTTGQDIEKDITIQSPSDLSTIGNIKIFSRGRRVDLKSLPEPPAHLSNDKMFKLSNWFDESVKDNICEVITKELVNSAKEDLAFKTSTESSLAKQIQSLVTEGNFKKFLSTYGSNERARNTPPEDVGKAISTNVLRQMRRVLKGSENRINKHIAAKNELKLKENNEEVLFETPSSITAELQDEHEMYMKMARKALILSKHEIINSVYRAIPINCNSCGGKPDSNNGKDEDDDEDAFYYTKKCYDKMQSLIGRPIYMKITKHVNVPTPTISSDVTTTSSTGASIRGARFRKKNPDLNIDKKMPELVPIGRKLPKLIPIDSKLPSNDNDDDSDDDDNNGDNNIPKNVEIGRELPKLIPIDSKLSSNNLEDSDDEMSNFGKISSKMPELVPISRELPKLIPIDSKLSSNNLEDSDDKMPDFGKISSKMPELIPIGRELPKLIPIDSKLSSNNLEDSDDEMPNFGKISSKIPELIPIRIEPLINIGQSVRDIQPEFIEINQEISRPNDGLPDIYDFIQKRKNLNKK
jgi:hypothetical protein